MVWYRTHLPFVEQTMFNGIIATYRRLAKPAGIREAARLNVMSLENRETPTVDFVGPAAAPEVITVAPEAKDAEPEVRTDLFGAAVGDTVEPKQSWHLWWAGLEAAQDFARASEASVEGESDAAPEIPVEAA